MIKQIEPCRSIFECLPIPLQMDKIESLRPKRTLAKGVVYSYEIEAAPEN